MMTSIRMLEPPMPPMLPSNPRHDPAFEATREWGRHYVFDSFKTLPLPGAGWVDLAKVAE